MRNQRFNNPLIALWLFLVQLSAVCHALPDARLETRVDQAFDSFGLDGEGVLVAILDRGIDWKNNDFRNEDGTTRIKYILDFTEDKSSGVTYTEQQINDALANDTELAHRDAVGHGSTTTGIAAGNGRNSQEATYRGIASKASLIVVKVTSDGAPAHGDQAAEAAFFDPNLVLVGIDFVVEKAQELGMPVVMLLNLGSTGGPTDGTDSISRKIDEIVGEGKPGIVFVTGPGDDGGSDNRASAEIQPGQSVDLEIEKGQSGNLRLDLWYPSDGVGESGLDFSITAPDNAVYGPYASPASESAADDVEIANVFRYYHRGRDVDFSQSTNQKRQVLIDIFGPTGTYILNISRPNSASDSRSFIATLNPSRYSLNPQNRFLNFVVPGNIWTGATAFNNITPTNYVLKDTWTDIDGIQRTDPPNTGAIGDIWTGSSVGPTFDGRLGIDVAAPGEHLITVYAPDSYWATFDFNRVDAFYGKANAVSAAAPLATGIIALMLQANPELDALQVREILRQTARSDAFTGEVPNATWGYGKIDAFNAAQAALQIAVGGTQASIIVASNGDSTITFQSIENASYSIEYKDDLLDSEWATLVSLLPSAGSETSYTDATLAPGQTRFYRIQLAD
ncbi:MAG: S8 family serine peptidase [Verrucomicrobiota bacterium]